MTDYGRIHQGVAWFGIWATDTADDYGKRDAALILAGAVEMCSDEDMREDREVRGALAYLARQGGHEKRVRAFRKALDVAHPDERKQAAAAALDAINRALGQTWGKIPDRL